MTGYTVVWTTATGLCAQYFPTKRAADTHARYLRRREHAVDVVPGKRFQ